MDIALALGVAGLMYWLSGPGWSSLFLWAIGFACGLAWAFFGAQSLSALAIVMGAGLVTPWSDRARGR